MSQNKDRLLFSHLYDSIIYESSINKNIELNNLKSFAFLESLRILGYTKRTVVIKYHQFKYSGPSKYEFLTIFLIKYNEYIRIDMIYLCKFHN